MQDLFMNLKIRIILRKNHSVLVFSLLLFIFKKKILLLLNKKVS